MISWTLDELEQWVSIGRPGWPAVQVLSKARPSLQAVQSFVGGHCEIAQNRLRVDGEPVQVLVNDEGRFNELPVNPTASHVCTTVIVGNAMILVGEARWE